MKAKTSPPNATTVTMKIMATIIARPRRAERDVVHKIRDEQGRSYSQRHMPAYLRRTAFT
jgi:hypothetical protein